MLTHHARSWATDGLPPSAGLLIDSRSAGRGVTLRNGGVGSVEGSAFSLLNIGYGEESSGPIICARVMVNVSREWETHREVAGRIRGARWEKEFW